MDEATQRPPARLTTKRPKPFVKRHSGWFALLGTLIVLGTFFANDVLREDAKHLSNSVEHAEDAFLQRTYYEDLREAMVSHTSPEKRKPVDLNAEFETFERGRSDEVLERLGMQPTAKNRGMTQEKFFREFDENQRLKRIEDGYLLYSPASFRFTMSTDFYKRLPSDEKLDKLRSNVSQSLVLWRQVLRDTSSVRYALDASEEESARAAFRHDAEVLTTHLQGKARSPQEGVDAFSDAVLRYAENLKGDTDHRADNWRICSFALYPLGAILGLMGKLYGEDVAEAE